MVTTQALIADVTPLRERGKYQGAMGAVFGVTTVLGKFGDLFGRRLIFQISAVVFVAGSVVAGASTSMS